MCNKDWISFYPALVSMRLEQKHIKLVGGEEAELIACVSVPTVVVLNGVK